MRRTEFYEHLSREGQGRFQLDGLGRIRASVIREGKALDYDPLSFVAWKLKGIDAPGEIERPATALEIKNPLRLVLAADLSRGYVGSTRRAMLRALRLDELDADARKALLNTGVMSGSRYGEIHDYDPDWSTRDDKDSSSEEIGNDDEDTWSEPEEEEDPDDGDCDCDECQEERRRSEADDEGEPPDVE